MENVAVAPGFGRIERIAILRLAAVLAIVVGVIHLIACTQHLAEAPLLGWGMLITGLAQLGAGILLLTQPSARIILALLGGTALALGIFFVEHTVGIPGLAHADAAAAIHMHAHNIAHSHGGGSEARQPLAVANVIAESALILALLSLLHRGPAEPV